MLFTKVVKTYRTHQIDIEPGTQLRVTVKMPDGGQKTCFVYADDRELYVSPGDGKIDTKNSGHRSLLAWLLFYRTVFKFAAKREPRHPQMHDTDQRAP